MRQDLGAVPGHRLGVAVEQSRPDARLGPAEALFEHRELVGHRPSEQRDLVDGHAVGDPRAAGA